ncbi:phenazine biosynthesis protein PhzF family protein [Escherichia coli]|nr:phenazine biosynthesis protein PhzF family protein [Escherichia coli]
MVGTSQRIAHDGKVLRVKGNQGRALGRDGVIEVTVTIRDNQPEKVTISGAGGDFVSCRMGN